MDRLAAFLEQLSPPAIARLLRRTVYAAVAVGAVCLGLALFLDHPLVGIGCLIGLFLGLVNIRLVTASVVHVGEHPSAHPKRVLASRTLARLMMTTIVVIGLAVASVSLGIATAGGLAVFYFLLVINLVNALLHPARSEEVVA